MLLGSSSWAAEGPAWQLERGEVLHGVAREVTGKAEVRREGAGRRVRAEFPLTLTDFAITPPVYLGVGVGNRLLVRVQFTATPARSAGK